MQYMQEQGEHRTRSPLGLFVFDTSIFLLVVHAAGHCRFLEGDSQAMRLSFLSLPGSHGFYPLLKTVFLW